MDRYTADQRVTARGDGFIVTTAEHTFHVLPNATMGWGIFTGDNLDLCRNGNEWAIGYADPDEVIGALLHTDDTAKAEKLRAAAADLRATADQPDTNPDTAAKLREHADAFHTEAALLTAAAMAEELLPAENDGLEDLDPVTNADVDAGLYEAGCRDGAAAHRHQITSFDEARFGQPDYRRGLRDGRSAAIDDELRAHAGEPARQNIHDDTDEVEL